MQSKKHDGHKDVEEIKYSEEKHEAVERPLNKLLGEDNYAHEVANTSNHTKHDLKHGTEEVRL